MSFHFCSKYFGGSAFLQVCGYLKPELWTCKFNRLTTPVLLGTQESCEVWATISKALALVRLRIEQFQILHDDGLC